MFYKSSLGCIEYYDEVLRISKLCDPTMLFILGLEAVTTSQEEYYKDIPVIDPETGKQKIDPETGDPITESVIDNIKLRKIIIYKDRVSDQEIYDKIVNYLKITGETLARKDHIEFYCAGMKIFMDQLTGKSDNRIVPIIFHDARQYNVALSDEDRLDFNKIYSVLSEIFSTAGQKSQTYKYIDYKSMYSYALGVLYGCKCLGYSDDVIWRLDPSMWYTDQYTSLVSTAYLTFNHRYNHPIKCIDHDKKLLFKYKGIQPNKLWNFDESSITVAPDGYTLTLYYDLSRLISIYVFNADKSLMWDGNTSVPIVDFGYTKTPSELRELYFDSLDLEPGSYTLRYNKASEYGYWSEDWLPKQWKQNLEGDLFLKDSLISLYMNESVIVNEIQSYTKTDDELLKYIYNNRTIDKLIKFNRGFILLSELYNSGITTYPCEIVYTDPYGRSLLDIDGTPLVWYDSKTKLYWNGVNNINKWQSKLPEAGFAIMYDSLEHTHIDVNDNPELQIIMYNDDSDISHLYLCTEQLSLICYEHYWYYTDFYAVPNYGIIRERAQVFNSLISDSPIECYIDTYSDEYCIPGVTDYWMSRNEIIDLGFQFVDGVSSLYLCTDKLNLVYDTDLTD